MKTTWTLCLLLLCGCGQAPKETWSTNEVSGYYVAEVYTNHGISGTNYADEVFTNPATK